MKKIITLLALFSIAAFTQQQGTFTDSRDGKEYRTVKIGEQTWMAQNLDYHGDDGNFGLCYEDEPKRKIRNPENCEKYGRLYDWNEAMKACPEGWHLPSYKEWQILWIFAGGDHIAGKKLKAKNGWMVKCRETDMTDLRKPKITDNCGTDAYGFSALPGGKGFSEYSQFNGADKEGYWWSASLGGGNLPFFMKMEGHRSGLGISNTHNSYSHSVRCLQD